ncbi:MAG: lysophospholipid acyltransferase family protein, partial [Pseudomonadota bacterium]
ALPGSVTDKLLYGAAQDRWFIKGQRKKELNSLYQSFVLGTFPIRRGGGARALSYASELLEHDHHIFLFPEGTRATASELGEFKPGVALLAIKHQVPVIPLYLHGLAAIRPKGTRRQIPGPVSMDILPAQYFSAEHDVAQATFQLRASMNAARNNRLDDPHIMEDTPLQTPAKPTDTAIPTSTDRAA